MAIKGVHVILYTPEAEELRATLRDKLGWDDYVDAHGGRPGEVELPLYEPSHASPLAEFR